MGLSNTDCVMAILSAKQNHCFSPVEEMGKKRNGKKCHSVAQFTHQNEQQEQW